MRIVGYCTECRRIRQVNASGSALAVAASRQSVIQGICSDCEEKAREKRRTTR